ncbi:ribonucleases P/MRP protein subunit POP1-domain-containing protein [Zopfochytrium polystomum]|nr:ribonucleases P/MRP protein subunit POP1-domain-containing protein [Zopfochytrium polystomum]
MGGDRGHSRNPGSTKDVQTTEGSSGASAPSAGQGSSSSAGAGNVSKKRPADGSLAPMNSKQRRKEKQSMSYQRPKGEENKTVHIEAFIQSRAFEIRALEKAVSNATEFTGSARVFQTLPRHMRRRAASYNVKRIPRKERQRAIDEAKANPKDAQVKKNRRVRRRPEEISEMFGKRSQAGKLWLQTHIWHAKRMHMTQLWGFMLPAFPNDKGTRATFRFSNHQCVIHDVSYYRCIELKGTLEEIARVMKIVCDPLLPPVEKFSDGTRQGQTFIHRPNRFPDGAVCPAKFQFTPFGAVSQDSQLWLWIHPSAERNCIDSLIEALVICGMTTEKLRNVSEKLSRFELVGPRSHAILFHSLKVSSSQDSAASQVWQRLEHLRTPASLPPGVVISLEVYDPRLTCPLARQLCLGGPQNLSASRIFSASAGHNFAEQKASEDELNKRRSKALIPGTKLPLEGPTIPIMLVQRKSLGTDFSTQLASQELVCGWDLIVPSQWSVEFWKTLVFAGARAIGLDDRRRLHLESGIPSFPYDYPETQAFVDWSVKVASDERETWEKRPKANRVNYETIGIKSPFQSQFASVVGLNMPSQTSGEAETVGASNLALKPVGVKSSSSAVQQPELNRTVPVFHSPKLVSTVATAIEKNPDLDAAIGRVSGYFKSKAPSAEDVVHLSFVRVQVSMLSRGAPSERAIVYAMPSEFFEHLVSVLKADIEQPLVGSVLDDAAWDRFLAVAPSESGLASKLLDKVPDEADIIGYVTSGGYSLSCGRGAALASCSVKGLHKVFWTAEREARPQAIEALARTARGAKIAGKVDTHRLVLVRDVVGRL